MALTEYAFTKAVDTTEWCATSDTAFTTQSETVEGQLQGWLDLSDMAGTDELQIRFYGKVIAGGTLFPIALGNPTGPQSEPFIFPSFLVKHGWTVTVKAIIGTITVNGSIRLAPI